MAYAKPVVATAVDGIPELIKDGVDGFLLRTRMRKTWPRNCLPCWTNPLAAGSGTAITDGAARMPPRLRRHAVDLSIPGCQIMPESRSEVP